MKRALCKTAQSVLIQSIINALALLLRNGCRLFLCILHGLVTVVRNFVCLFFAVKQLSQCTEGCSCSFQICFDKNDRNSQLFLKIVQFLFHAVLDLTDVDNDLWICRNYRFFVEVRFASVKSPKDWKIYKLFSIISLCILGNLTGTSHHLVCCNGKQTLLRHISGRSDPLDLPFKRNRSSQRVSKLPLTFLCLFRILSTFFRFFCCLCLLCLLSLFGLLCLRAGRKCCSHHQCCQHQSHQSDRKMFFHHIKFFLSIIVSDPARTPDSFHPTAQSSESGHLLHKPHLKSVGQLLSADCPHLILFHL